MTGALLSAVVLGMVVRGWLPDLVACAALVPAFLALVRDPHPARAGLVATTAYLGLVTAAFEGTLAAIPWAFPLTIAASVPWLALPGLLSAGAVRLGPPGFAVWMLPFTWTACEFIAGQRWIWGAGASPIALGYTQIDGPLLHVARIAGVHGVSFLVLATNAAIAHCLLLRKAWPLLGLTFTVVAALVAAPNRGSTTSQTGPSLSVGVVQPAIEKGWYQASSILPEAQQHVLQRLRVLSEPNFDVDLLVWPEGAVPPGIPLEDLPRHLRDVTSSGTEVVVGAVTEREGRRYNSVVHVGNRVTPIYDKLAPVPIGERGISPGNWLVVARWANRLVAPLICLDSVYPTFARRLAQFGAELLLVLSDDSFAQHMSTPVLHLTTSRFRAVETGLPLIFASAAGPSAVISPFGEIIAVTTSGDSTVLTAELIRPTSTTLFVRYGNWAGMACVAVTVLLVLATVSDRQRFDSKLRPSRPTTSESA
jgi:apolipoprotein N-acyltransferase